MIFLIFSTNFYKKNRMKINIYKIYEYIIIILKVLIHGILLRNY